MDTLTASPGKWGIEPLPALLPDQLRDLVTILPCLLPEHRPQH